MNLGSLGHQTVVTLNLSDHCRRAAQLMKDHDIRHLPVLDDDAPVGMVSQRNLLAAIGWWGSDRKHSETPISDWAERLPVAEVMTTPVVCLPPDASLEKAARLMLNKKISALPLVGQGRLQGIVTESDFLHHGAANRSWQRTRVMNYMTAHIVSVPPHELIRAAWRLMHEKQIRHLVVMENGRLRGVLSQRDLLAGITWDAAGPQGIQDQVRHIMTTRITTITPESTLAQAALHMTSEKIGALPVADGDYLVGMITETDLLEQFAREMEKGAP